MFKYILFCLLFVLPSIVIAKGTCKAHAEAFIGILEFDVTGCNVTGELKEDNGKLLGEFKVDLKTLDTGLDLRNEHMRDKYLETDKFPNASFILDPLKIGSDKFTGKFSLHGKTKTIKGDVISSSKNNLNVKFKLNLEDFSIETPSYKGITIAKHIDVSVDIKK